MGGVGEKLGSERNKTSKANRSLLRLKFTSQIPSPLSLNGLSPLRYAAEHSVFFQVK